MYGITVMPYIEEDLDMPEILTYDGVEYIKLMDHHQACDLIRRMGNSPEGNLVADAVKLSYIILLKPSAIELHQFVNNFIGAGWKPQGGVGHHPGVWFQAMVKGNGNG